MPRGIDTRNHPNRRPTPRLARALSGYLSDKIEMMEYDYPTLGATGEFTPPKASEITEEGAQKALDSYRTLRDRWAKSVGEQQRESAMRQDIKNAIVDYR